MSLRRRNLSRRCAPLARSARSLQSQMRAVGQICAAACPEAHAVGQVGATAYSMVGARCPFSGKSSAFPGSRHGILPPVCVCVCVCVCGLASCALARTCPCCTCACVYLVGRHARIALQLPCWLYLGMPVLHSSCLGLPDCLLPCLGCTP